jgi:hypothetical protein
MTPARLLALSQQFSLDARDTFFQDCHLLIDTLVEQRHPLQCHSLHGQPPSRRFLVYLFYTLNDRPCRLFKSSVHIVIEAAEETRSARLEIPLYNITEEVEYMGIHVGQLTPE